MTTLHIHLLGGFQLYDEDAPVATIMQARQQALLAYLLLHRHTPQSRQHLAFLFWPDSTEAQARTNLRRELHQLRHTLPQADRFLTIGAQTVQWRADAPYTLDVVDFERALALTEEAQRAGQIAMVCTRLAQAIKLYTDDLLPGCYDEWLLNDRERLRQRYLGALEQLAQLQEEQAQYREAIAVAERLLRHDPIHEETYQRLMRLHLLNGDRAHALRVYHLCTAALQRELGVEPSPETHALYARLLAVEVAPRATTTPIPAPVPIVEGTQLVARQAEWQQLQRAWQRARQGKIHFALIAGEAGIGKTRLAEELLTWASQHAIPTAKTRSYAAEGRLAYAPVVEWLRSDAIQVLRLPLGDVWLGEVARLLPEVLEERPTLPHPGPLTESWQRLRFFEALSRAVLLGSQPLLLLIDDLQWCDQDTLEWLRYLMHFAQGAAAQLPCRERLLIVGTARAEEVGAHHPLKTLLLELRNTEQLTEIELGPFSETETTQLACTVAGHALNAAQLVQLYRDTAGNPLFVVETLRSGGGEKNAALLGDRRARADQDADPQAHRQADRLLPPKIDAVIQSRLAQLSPPAGALAALAAIMGRAFTFALLATAGDTDETTLVQALDELWQRRILREHGAGGYDFSHDRIRDVAYAEISPARRRLLHRRVAQALEQSYQTDLETVSSQIAGHYAQAGLPEPALRYYEQAALVAQQIYAHEDAVASLTKALALLPQLPLTPERLRQELRLQLDLGLSLGTLKGFAAPEIRELYGRANELAEQVGNDEQRQMVNSGLFSYAIWRVELQSALALAEQAIALAERNSDRSWLGAAYGRRGVVLSYLGQWQASRLNLEQAVAAVGDLHRPVRTRFEAAAQSPMVLHRRFLATTLWCLGYPDQALVRAQEALTLAKELAHPYTLAQALSGSAGFRWHRREIQEARTLAEAAIAFAQQHGFRNVLVGCQMLIGQVLVQQGQVEAGIAQMHEAMAFSTASRHQLYHIESLAALADAYNNARKPAQGLPLLDQALAHMEATGERRHEVELHQLKGELLHMQGEESRVVEAHFLQALTVARQQEAKMLELRAAMSLCRLWQEKRRFSEARDLLAGIYTWFTEGFDTPDLQEAQSLLAELTYPQEHPLPTAVTPM